MIKLPIILLLILMPSLVEAKVAKSQIKETTRWSSQVKKDPITDKITYQASGFTIVNKLPLLFTIECNNSKASTALLTIMFNEKLSYRLALSTLMYRVDGGTPKELRINVGEGGLLATIDLQQIRTIVSDFLAGKKVLLRVETPNATSQNYVLPMSGAKPVIQDIMGKCGL